MGLFLFVFTALCIVTAIHIRIRDMGDEKKKILRCARDDRETAGGASPAPTEKPEGGFCKRKENGNGF